MASGFGTGAIFCFCDNCRGFRSSSQSLFTTDSRLELKLVDTAVDESALASEKERSRDAKLFLLEHNDYGDSAVPSDEKLYSCYIYQQQHDSPVEAAATRSLLDNLVRSINIDE